MRRRCGIALAAWGGALLLGRLASASPVVHDPGCGEMWVAPRPGVLVLGLPHTFLRAGSDSIWSARGAWRPGVDYSLDCVRGELRLLREASPGETLHVRACWLVSPPAVELQRYRYRPMTASPESAAVIVAPQFRPVTAHAAGTPSGASLALTGNKTLAVELGSSQDAVLRQSLDLALTGTLSPGVQLTGVLSDRNTPITSSGSTLDLQSADQVKLELTAPQGAATLGDLTLRFDQGEFGRLERRLQGVRGEWTQGGATLVVAAASAAGEFNRLQFFGTDGQQGPYVLTDRDGGAGITVVPGSEVVVLDGQRLVRGETADYSMDYERARLTFSNRHLISSASHITIDYQFALRRFKRNLTAAEARWGRGPIQGFARVLSEADDRGRPLGVPLDANDRLALALAGDSASFALGTAISAGVGDYDTVRVSPTQLVFAFAGPDSGSFVVQFAAVGVGHGDYADSAVVNGRTAYRYVGLPNGSFRVGRALPLPESHTLMTMGARARAGAAALEVEGATSLRDLNTFSTLDDGDNRGFAGRARVRIEGRPRGAGGRVGLELDGRTVDRRFSPFARLEQPFESERWAVPATADFEHARRVDLRGDWLGASGATLKAEAGALSTPDGLDSRRTAFTWDDPRAVETHVLWERASVERSTGLARSGGRDHARLEARWHLTQVVPMLRWEFDERRFPGDSARSGDRFRSVGGELASGAKVTWRTLVGYEVRRDARATPSSFEEQSESRSCRLALDSPAGEPWGVSGLAQRRDVLPRANPVRTRSDLATVRLRAESARRGLKGELDEEIGSEGENRRVRRLTFVGAGRGAYDALGNFVGTGDYDLTLTVSPALDRLSRAATHGQTGWTFGHGDAWRGSRLEFTFESEARRRGALFGTDAFISPGATLGDPGLARASVLQRLEAELSPQSRAAGLRLRLERRVGADRSFENFAQTTDNRLLNLRWRTRPTPVFGTELELEGRREIAEQSLLGAASYHRALDLRRSAAQIVVTPGARLRLVGAVEFSWARADRQPDATRTLQLGPDAGISVGARGRAELSLRRAFLSGPPAVALIPTADPAGAPRWQGTGRFDYRWIERLTLGVSSTVREFEGRSPIYNGRAEMRAFF